MGTMKDANFQTEETVSKQICQYCGKPYKHIKSTFTVCGENKEMHNDEPNCNCLEDIKQKKLTERRKKLKIEKTEKIFNNSMMTPFFREKTFDELEQTAEILRCKEYADNFIPNESNGIQMIGNPGTGKTTALAAICNELISQGYNCLFTPLSTLLDKFSSHSYSNSGDITGLLEWLKDFDFVVLDDIGRETYTDKRKENAFRIIDTLMNYKVVTAFTANPEMIIKLKSIQELSAALDRLKDMCTIKIEFHGESRRGQ